MNILILVLGLNMGFVLSLAQINHPQKIVLASILVLYEGRKVKIHFYYESF